MVQIVFGVLSKPSKADGNYCPSHRGGNYSRDGEQRIRRWENFLSGTFQLSALLFQHLVGERDKRETVLICNLEMFLAVQNSSIGLIVRPLVPLSDTTNNQSRHNTTEQS